MNNQLTTRQFWLDYWESKTDLVFEVSDSYMFTSILTQLVSQNQSKTLLEIGGFPGYFSVWAKRKLNLNATLLDYVVHQRILNELEIENQLSPNTIGVIEADLFAYTPKEKFDLVVSNGLIEHFKDTKNIIEKHTEQLADKGVLLITLPNFRGLNGWFQKTFDPENYSKHNINCMDIQLLEKICKELNLKNIQIYYNGRFMLWLENENQKSIVARLLKRVLWLPIKIFFKIIPIETKAFSPYIVITANK
jgi:cyclopropane fatty-acyl-phospholipid synthase-like methyltransferase